MTRSQVLAIFVLLAFLSCQAQQEEPVPQPSTTSASHQETERVELPEGSSILRTLQTEPVKVRPLKKIVKAQAARILANENRLTHLSPRVPGHIVRVSANLGDRVKAGQPLLILESPQVAAEQMAYRKAKSRFSVAEQGLERAKLLLERKAIGTAEFQRREGEYQSALAELQEAEEHLHHLSMTEEEVERLTSGPLPHAQVAQVALRAPFAGEVIQRKATIGEVVDPTTVVFTVADLSTVWVQAEFPEQQAALLVTGLPIEVRVAAYPQEIFRGKVIYVGAMVDPATRTLMVRSEVPNPHRQLRPEMFADVSLTTNEEPALAVPASALQQAGGRTIVFVVKGPRTFEPRTLSVGSLSGSYAHVLSGLSEGDVVVTEGSYALKSEALREQLLTGGDHD